MRASTFVISMSTEWQSDTNCRVSNLSMLELQRGKQNSAVVQNQLRIAYIASVAQ